MISPRQDLTQDLPSQLPGGEQPLWRGGPDGSLLARQALHVRKVATYFLLLLAWRLFLVWRDGFTLTLAVDAAVTTLALGIVVTAALYGYGVWSAKNTTYTITTERIVIRTGIALSVAINLPFSKIANVDMRHTHRRQPSAGDVVLSLADGAKAAYIILWPNAKPFRFFRTQPMLRALANVDVPAKILAEALGAHAQRHQLAGTATAPRRAASDAPATTSDTETGSDMTPATS
ncbi:MAG: photosynthetic complex putative assembly protein PuhB [Pseudomonadota bacterium]